MSGIEICLDFLAAVSAGERQTALSVLAGDVELIWVGTHLRGATAVVDWVMSPSAPGVYRAGLWELSESTSIGILVRGRVEERDATSAARVTDRIGALLSIELAGKTITRIRHQPVGSGRPGSIPLRLTRHMTRAINGALAATRPLQIAYLCGGVPVITTRGSVTCLNDRRLGFWLRDRNGRFAEAIGEDPQVALVYSDMPIRLNLLMQGRAYISEDAATRTRVFAAAHPREREHDHLLHGAAVIIDLDVIEGLCADDPELSTDGVNMSRAAQ